MVVIQYASDLHINDFPESTPFNDFLIPVAPILIVAGDVCRAQHPRYLPFLTWCSQHWTDVILITGNHEYYCEPEDVQRNHDETDEYVAGLCMSLQNVHFLQDGASFTLPRLKLRFVGATFWTDIDPSIHADISTKKGDYTMTYFGRRRTTPSDIVDLHTAHKQSLRASMMKGTSDERLVVVTHHMPTKELLEPEFKGEAWHTCYASDCDDLLTLGAKVWVCGHSHRATEYKHPSGTLCLMNARGYKNDYTRAADAYNSAATFTLPPVI